MDNARQLPESSSPSRLLPWTQKIQVQPCKRGEKG